MQTAIARSPFVLLLVPLLLLAACSDDDDSAPATGPAGSAATISGSVGVDFTGAPQELDVIEATFEVEAGTTAWDAIKVALGEENLAFEDFGGDLGIFITGFNGVQAEGNHFWEFKVNGETAEAGVSKYEVTDGDVLEFVYSSF